MSKISCSSVLFKSESGSALKFVLPPCEEKGRIRELVELGGGELSSKFRPGSIRLCVPGKTVHEDGVVSIQYIHDCVERNELLDMKKYRMSRGDVSSGRDDVVSDDDMQHASVIVRVRAKERMGRSKYLLSDDKKIIRYILEENAYGQVKGNKVWRDIEMLGVLPGRTWQSIKDRYLKQILPNIASFGLQPHEVAKLTDTVVTSEPSGEAAHKPLKPTYRGFIKAPLEMVTRKSGRERVSEPLGGADATKTQANGDQTGKDSAPSPFKKMANFTAVVVTDFMKSNAEKTTNAGVSLREPAKNQPNSSSRGVVSEARAVILKDCVVGGEQGTNAGSVSPSAQRRSLRKPRVAASEKRAPDSTEDKHVSRRVANEKTALSPASKKASNSRTNENAPLRVATENTPDSPAISSHNIKSRGQVHNNNDEAVSGGQTAPSDVHTRVMHNSTARGCPAVSPASTTSAANDLDLALLDDFDRYLIREAKVSLSPIREDDIARASSGTWHQGGSSVSVVGPTPLLSPAKSKTASDFKHAPSVPSSSGSDALQITTKSKGKASLSSKAAIVASPRKYGRVAKGQDDTGRTSPDRPDPDVSTEMSRRCTRSRRPASPEVTAKHSTPVKRKRKASPVVPGIEDGGDTKSMMVRQENGATSGSSPRGRRATRQAEDAEHVTLRVTSGRVVGSGVVTTGSPPGRRKAVPLHFTESDESEEESQSILSNSRNTRPKDMSEDGRGQSEPEECADEPRQVSTAGLGSSDARGDQGLHDFLMLETQGSGAESQSLQDEDTDVSFEDEETARQVDDAYNAMKMVCSMYDVSMEEVYSLVYFTSGKLKDVHHYLQHGTTRDGKELWNEEDDVILQHGSEDDYSALERRYGEQSVLSRQQFLASFLRSREERS